MKRISAGHIVKNWFKSLFTSNYLDWHFHGVITNETNVFLKDMKCFTGKAKIDGDDFGIILIPFTNEKAVEIFLEVLNLTLNPNE